MLLLIIGLALIFMGTAILLWPENERDKKMTVKWIGDKGKTNKEWSDIENKGEGVEIKGGAVVMIGPIPLVMGSDHRTALLMTLLAIVLMILWIVAMKGI
jgi:uncharacterized protein (TIGR00304 family)